MCSIKLLVRWAGNVERWCDVAWQGLCLAFRSHCIRCWIRMCECAYSERDTVGDTTCAVWCGTFRRRVANFCFPVSSAADILLHPSFCESASSGKQSDSPACLHDLMMMKDELQSPVTSTVTRIARGSGTLVGSLLSSSSTVCVPSPSCRQRQKQRDREIERPWRLSRWCKTTETQRYLLPIFLSNLRDAELRDAERLVRLREGVHTSRKETGGCVSTSSDIVTIAALGSRVHGHDVPRDVCNNVRCRRGERIELDFFPRA